MNSRLSRPDFSGRPAIFGLVAAAVAFALAIADVAAAQGANSPASAASPGGASNQVCGRLEAQLAAIDRGVGSDPARAEQARRFEDTLNKQQAELDRTQAQWQRLGCQQVGLFSIFANQAPACGPLNGQIQQMRTNIDRAMGDLQRTRRGGDDEMQRQGVLGALAQNNCGPQYRAAAPQPQRNFFETLFGGPATATATAPPPSPSDSPQVGGGGYRTLCVRICDGYYFPISFSTSPSRFIDDEQACQRQCPAAETVLYSHRNPGEDVAQAVASNGRSYRDLPNAFRYRREFVAACSCRQPGQSWAEALAGRDSTVERGDIVVNEERAKALAQPRDAQGRTQAAQPFQTSQQRPEARRGAATPGGATATPAAPATPVTTPSDATDPGAAAPAADPAKRNVRPVGPTFIPAQ